jgi:protein-S-isoprenylcysteine O-methyltransferase Ste14
MPPALTARTGRWYFGAQAIAGGAWWIGVTTSDFIRQATLGDLNPGLVALFDIPLFVIASAIAARGVRWAVWVVVSWTVSVAAAMSLYATLTTLAGWGALLMIAAAAGSVGAGPLVLRGRLPVEWILIGPFGFRPAKAASTGTHVMMTVGQLVIFWGLFLVAGPVLIVIVERRWGMSLDVPAAVHIAGVVLLVLASTLGLWSAWSMSSRGQGTPLPSAMPNRLVVAGPYRFVRNPMAIAGVAQGVAVGMVLGSWLVIAYALCGSLVWNHLVRPSEEHDLERRFGAEFLAYRRRVRCWMPRFSPGRP